ncbi:hypothetical protein CERSUDRAFT_76629 [Gelatoporia subvermispora B]|uniref:Uncharacterized protein n=1 Tax=Ceriporiopsis subvermispora (strain B) TaxID=914234 RepID=M2QML1_CERS8|nr:hypothetical protein CERSUDRAFT_76629 [Gelatoporia subvermispora B]
MANQAGFFEPCLPILIIYIHLLTPTPTHFIMDTLNFDGIDRDDYRDFPDLLEQARNLKALFAAPSEEEDPEPSKPEMDDNQTPAASNVNSSKSTASGNDKMEGIMTGAPREPEGEGLDIGSLEAGMNEGERSNSRTPEPEKQQAGIGAGKMLAKSSVVQAPPESVLESNKQAVVEAPAQGPAMSMKRVAEVEDTMDVSEDRLPQECAGDRPSLPLRCWWIMVTLAHQQRRQVWAWQTKSATETHNKVCHKLQSLPNAPAYRDGRQQTRCLPDGDHGPPSFHCSETYCFITQPEGLNFHVGTLNLSALVPLINSNIRQKRFVFFLAWRAKWAGLIYKEWGADEVQLVADALEGKAKALFPFRLFEVDLFNALHNSECLLRTIHNIHWLSTHVQHASRHKEHSVVVFIDTLCESPTVCVYWSHLQITLFLLWAGAQRSAAYLESDKPIYADHVTPTIHENSMVSSIYWHKPELQRQYTEESIFMCHTDNFNP